MDGLVRILIGLAALAFVLAVFGSVVVGGPIFGAPPEALSRACNNLALLAIALSLVSRGAAPAS